MAILEGKSPNERNKMILAGVLGLVALVALYMAFGRGGSSTSVKVTTSPTPRPSVSPGAETPIEVPSAAEQDFVYQTTPIDYRPGMAGAPDPGRNIFAFYEPPLPCPTCPTPIPPPPATPKPTPTPTPLPFQITAVTPGGVYAGSQGFRMEVNGNGFTQDAKIYFNQNQLPTSFVSAQKLTTEIPANFITQEGPRQVIVQTPDGKLYSDQYMWTVQAPPRPQVQYVGVIARKRGNNDTAIFTEQGKPTPFTARLNDVVGGRFRLINITPSEVTFEDTSLGFKHRVAVMKGAGGVGTGGATFGQPQGAYSNPSYDPNSAIPGVPQNIPRYVPPQPQQQKKKEDDNGDVDDEDDGPE